MRVRVRVRGARGMCTFARCARAEWRGVGFRRQQLVMNMNAPRNGYTYEPGDGYVCTNTDIVNTYARRNEDRFSSSRRHTRIAMKMYTARDEGMDLVISTYTALK